MKENGKDSSFRIPCLYDHKKPCVDCNLYSTNLESIRKLAKNRSFRNYFSRLVGEFPTTRQVSELIFHFDDRYPAIHTETFGLTHIPSPLLEVGYDIAKIRREYVVKRSERLNFEDYAFKVRCPNYINSPPANPTAQVDSDGE